MNKNVVFGRSGRTLRGQEMGDAAVDGFEYADDLGPHKVLHVHEPELGLQGAMVIDNIAAGPAIGGLRMAPDVTTAECFRLARAMTLKNAAAGLPHGGAKSVIAADPRMDGARKERLIRCFAAALRHEHGYIIGPDMGTNESCMAWVHDEIGRSVGLPRELGGIPLDEIGATGWGVFHAIAVAVARRGERLEGQRVAVQGFGAVGSHAARFLCAEGAVLVAAADSSGTIVNPKGIDPDALRAHKAAGHGVTGFAGGTPGAADDIVGVDCDIWIPAARPDVLTEHNVDRLRARIVAQGANIPATPAAEQRLHDKGVVVLPDFIANAGGVICAAMEFRGASQKAAFDMIEERIRHNTEEVLSLVDARGVPPRQAAMDMALARVRRAMTLRRWSTF